MRYAAPVAALLAGVLVLAGCASHGTARASHAGAAVSSHGPGSAPASRPAASASAAASAASSAVAAARARAAAAASTGPAASAATAVRTVTPWTASGRLTVASTGTAAGSCFTTSLAAPSPTTYRCFHGNTLLDPCFLSPTSTHTVACLAAPWSTAQVLTLATAPPPPVRTGSGRVWALSLADGTRCVADTGTVPLVAGVNLSYDCGDGTFAEPLDPSAATPVVQRGRLDATTLARVAVSVMWRA